MLVSVCLPYIGPASFAVVRILRDVGIKVYHSSNNKLFRVLCTHEDGKDDLQKPGVCCIFSEYGLVYNAEATPVEKKDHKRRMTLE